MWWRCVEQSACSTPLETFLKTDCEGWYFIEETRIEGSRSHADVQTAACATKTVRNDTRVLLERWTRQSRPSGLQSTSRIACAPQSRACRWKNSVLQVTATIDPQCRTEQDRIYWRCATDSIWEGRLAATRWLIEFVGIKQGRGGNPVLRKRPEVPR